MGCDLGRASLGPRDGRPAESARGLSIAPLQPNGIGEVLNSPLPKKARCAAEILHQRPHKASERGRRRQARLRRARCAGRHEHTKRVWFLSAGRPAKLAPHPLAYAHSTHTGLGKHCAHHPNNPLCQSRPISTAALRLSSLSPSLCRTCCSAGGVNRKPSSVLHGLTAVASPYASASPSDHLALSNHLPPAPPPPSRDRRLRPSPTFGLPQRFVSDPLAT